MGKDSFRKHSPHSHETNTVTIISNVFSVRRFDGVMLQHAERFLVRQERQRGREGERERESAVAKFGSSLPTALLGATGSGTSTGGLTGPLGGGENPDPRKRLETSARDIYQPNWLREGRKPFLSHRQSAGDRGCVRAEQFEPYYDSRTLRGEVHRF